MNSNTFGYRKDNYDEFIQQKAVINKMLTRAVKGFKTRIYARPFKHRARTPKVTDKPWMLSTEEWGAKMNKSGSQ